MSNLPSAPSSNLHPLEEIYGNLKRIRTIFIWFILFIALGLLAGIFISLSAGDIAQAGWVAIGFLPIIAAYYFIQRLNFEAASILLAVVMITLITVVAMNDLGIHHLSVIGYPAILIVASLVTRKRTMTLMTIYTIACVAWLVFGELGGAYVPAQLEQSVPGDFFTMAMILILTAVMVRMITESLFQTNRQLQRELQERKSAEQALAFSEKRFYQAFQTSPIMMTIENQDKLFVDVNPSFTEGMGFNREEAIGHSASELGFFVSPEESEIVRKLVDDQKPLRNLELHFRRKSGEVGFALLSSDQFEANGATYELTSALDITDRKQIEAEREALIAELKAKNTELEQFTYTVSHDLKAPIITIKGFLGFLEQDVAEGNLDRIHDDVKRINEAVDKMNRLLNELLELSRIGRMMNPPQSVSMGELVREAVEIVQGNLEARSVVVNIQPNLPLIHGDRQRLVMVIQNLIDNSAKFMGQQTHPSIEIGQRGEEDGNPIFFVKDNGIGIAPEYHEKVFGLFNKLDPKVEGTGVGLALVKRIIEFHGGRIWIESELGKGCTIYFTLRPQPR